jgi:N-acetylated-alpha-linked acidic dipeptidase
VRDPNARVPVSAVARERRARDRGALPGGSSDTLIDNRLGSGSDYTVFLNHLGIPAADFTFDGPYGVYHSLYDTHRWVATIGDPGFRYHRALVQLWGIVTLRLANADALPLDYAPYVTRILSFVDEVERNASTSVGRQATLEAFADLRRAAGELQVAAATFNAARDAALAQGDGPALERVNAAVLLVERQLTDPDGIPNRPWYRHQIYAPQYTYAPEVLPGITEAVNARDARGANAQAVRVSSALRRAAAVLLEGPRQK